MDVSHFLKEMNSHSRLSSWLSSLDHVLESSHISGATNALFTDDL